MVIARAGQGRPEAGGEMTPPAADGLHWRRRVKLLFIVEAILDFDDWVLKPSNGLILL